MTVHERNHERGDSRFNTFRELAMRVVLAPYVAMIIVIFFGGTFTFIQLTTLESQAALAFFSGFLVVLFLQGLTERGNELLGQWRSSNRYDLHSAPFSRIPKPFCQNS